MNDLITRRSIFIVSYQLEGICLALRLMIQTGATPGAETRKILRKLFNDLRSLIASGKVIEGLPEINDSTAIADLSAIAETLRTSALCFLSPDEQDEHKRSIGFAPS